MAFTAPFIRTVSSVGEKTRLRVEVDAENVAGFQDAMLFLWQQLEPTAPNQEPRAVCVGMCSPGDLDDYMPAIPEADAIPGFFRLAYFEMDFDSISMRETFWEGLLQQAQTLCNTMQKLTELDDPITVTITSES